MSKTNRRPLAVLIMVRIARMGDFIIKARSIVQNMTNNATYFPTPSPPLATVTTDIAKLETAETAAQSRTVGAVAARNLTYATVLTDLRNLLCYVQVRADLAGNEAAAISIIQASGFDVKVNGVKIKPPIAAKSMGTGIIRLTAKAAVGRVSYNWQSSSDNGATWHDLPSTIQSKTTVSGLVPASKWLFRVRAITKNGVGNFTDPTAVIVQ